MSLECLFPFGPLNPDFLSSEEQTEVVKKTSLKVIEAVKRFEYEKNNERHWNIAKLRRQVVDKTLAIEEALY